MKPLQKLNNNSKRPIRLWSTDIGYTKLWWILPKSDLKFPFIIILYIAQYWYSITKVMLLLNWPLGIVVQLLQWRIRPLWHVYERDKLLSWLQKKITITRLKTYVSEEILKWHSHSLSHSAYICIHFYCLSRLGQASKRIMIQSSALWLRLSQFKNSSDTYSSL